jgi:hypothetical protein
MNQMGDEIEGRLKKYINDSHRSTVQKIANACDKAVIDVKELDSYTTETFKVMQLNINSISKEMESKLPAKAIKELLNDYARTRD